MDWERWRPNLERLSLFRWRFEWVLLTLAAVGVVFGEQAREARARDPYQLLTNGRTAAATVEGMRQEVVTLAVRRGEPIQELRTFADLSWFDDNSERRGITNYRLDAETVEALRIDVGNRSWPAYLNIHYLERSPASEGDPADPTQVMPQGVTSTAFQGACQPARFCRLVVLLPEGKSRAEQDADLIDLALSWGPRAVWFGIGGLLLLLALRFRGVIDNRPTLE